MNFQPPAPKGGLHRTLRVLTLLLLQHALAPFGSDAFARMRLPFNPASDSNSRPYLLVAGAPSLRFRATPPAIPIAVAKVETPTSSAAQPAIAALPGGEPAHPTATVEPIAAPAAPVVEPVDISKTAAATKPAPNIIPDDTRPNTRPEDFLPYFRFPARSDVVIPSSSEVSQPPAPGQLPASSATYQQR